MPVRRGEFEPILDALDHRGPDGRRISWHRAAALGHQHRWTTPEESGERQPLVAGDGCEVAFDGRLDNRAEILRALGIRSPSGGSRAMSDAELVARSHARWGASCFARFLGPFAIAIFDPRDHRVVCARDGLGDRSLFYYWDGEVLLAGSEEHALCRHSAVGDELDEETVARFFALRGPRPGATFFTALRELPAGHYLKLADGCLELRRFWQLDPGARLSYGSDGDYADHFRQLLIDSVRCRMRAPSPPSVLMSGGLDSTSVAAIAAKELGGRRGGRLRTISWVFDELVEQDERRFIDPMVRRHDLESTLLEGDDAWPLRDLATWQVNPNTPVRDLYRLRERAYAASARAGCATMLSGDLGDNLYYGLDFWLRDLLAEGRVAEASRATWRFLTADPAPAGFKLKRMRNGLARALGWRGRRPPPPRWLTPGARALVGDGEPVPGAVEARRPDQFRVVLDPVNAHEVVQEQCNAHRQGVELRFPFRDRRLIEFLLSVPAHQIYRPGRVKWILRQAMRDLLPEVVRRRVRQTCLLPLCARGLVEREWETVAALLEKPGANWPRYVSREWLWSGFPSHLRAGQLTAESVVAWRCICMELWRERREHAARAAAAPGVYNLATSGVGEI